MWRKVERTKVQSVSCVPEMSAARLGEIGGEMRGRDWARLGEIGRDEGMRLGEIGRDWVRLGQIGRDEGARLGEIGRDCACVVKGDLAPLANHPQRGELEVGSRKVRPPEHRLRKQRLGGVGGGEVGRGEVRPAEVRLGEV